MMRHVILVAVLFLSGCSTVPWVRAQGAETFDSLLEYGEWVICEAASIGAINRRYRTDDEQAARELLCETRNQRWEKLAP